MPNNINFAKRVMKVLFKLDDKAMDKVVRVINANSPQALDTSNIKQRVGNATVHMIQKALEAKSPENSDEDKSKDDDKSEEQVKESVGSFKEFIVSEAMVDVDLDNPNVAMQDVRKASRMAKQNPDRLTRQQMMDAKQKKKEAQQDTGPLKNLKQQIATTQEKLTLLNKRLRDAEKRENAGA